MKKINILILSVGRRVELVQEFKKAKEELQIEGEIFGGDMDKNAPAMQFVDKKFILPKIVADNYINEIIEICKKEKVDLIIPTIDTELLKLAENQDLIFKETGAKLSLSSLEFIKICRDKFLTYQFFKENGFGVPKLITEVDIENNNYKFPLFIKPLNGSSSINTFKINSQKELNFFKEYVSNPIIQEYVEGKEFTVDVFCDFNCQPITIVPRERIATRSGEISKGRIVKNFKLINEIKRMLKIFKARGQITIQCIENNNEIKYLEINPRFGGGAPMSIKAGANSAKNLYKIILGEKLEYNEDYEEDLLCLRYDQTTYIHINKEVKNK